jgi:PEGA domain-containing protein
MTSPANGDVVTAQRTALDDQFAIDDRRESNEDSLGLFLSEEEQPVSVSAAPIGTASVTLPPTSLSWLTAKPEAASAMIACAFAFGIVVGISVMSLAGVSRHLATATDSTRSQEPPHEPARLVPVVVPIRTDSTVARVDPQAVQPKAPATKRPTKSRTAPFRGVLVVNSRPSGAQVFLNGRSVGTTPLVLKNQTAGSRAVRLTLGGYDSWTSAVRVVADTETRLRAELQMQQPARP